VRLLGEGQSNKSIAAALGISERTARTHVSNILAKLGLSSRTQAALWAAREGIPERFV
jgi:DNA-binding NarL/FixJ family response regulator